MNTQRMICLLANFRGIYAQTHLLQRAHLSNIKILSDRQRLVINSTISKLLEESYIKKVKESSIDGDTWRNFALNCRRKLVKDPVAFLGSSDEFNSMLNLIEKSSVEVTDQIEPYLFRKMIGKAEEELKDTIDTFKALRSTSDMRSPPEWYPVARMLKRKIIYHGGPTNSGKTHHALERLRMADPEKGGGLFCGPLRLLALEVYERLNRNGVYTTLLTGQEREIVPFATHISCTVEMAPLQNEYDVVVIDEIQMIADSDRGHAWTRALLGLLCQEIHVCGGLEASDIVRHIAESCGDEFELKEYKRLSELKVAETSLKGDYSKVQPGDCIVAFSRADIFSIRRTIETMTSYRCAIIYGALPPETRSSQARLFNEGKYDILVSSDAIGMGLNLNIRRIIFHTILKKTGSINRGLTLLESSSVKQIGGRAGRHSSDFKIGIVTAWQEIDLAYIRAVMQLDVPKIHAACISPTLEQIQDFSENLNKLSETESMNRHILQLANQAYSEAIQYKKDNESDIYTGTQMTSEDNRENEFITLTQFQKALKIIEPNFTLAHYKCYCLEEFYDKLKTEFIVYGQENALKIRKIQKSSNEELDNTASPSQTIEEEKTLTDTSATPDTSLHHIRLSSLLMRFAELAQISNRYFLQNSTDVNALSNWLHTIPLSLSDRFTFANAPVKITNDLAVKLMYYYAAQYALKRPVSVGIRVENWIPRDVRQLSTLLLKYDCLELYLWLAIRYPIYFIQKDTCIQMKTQLIHIIQSSLVDSLKQKYSHSDYYFEQRCSILSNYRQGLQQYPIVHIENNQIRQLFLNEIIKISSNDMIQLPHFAIELKRTQKRVAATALPYLEQYQLSHIASINTDIPTYGGPGSGSSSSSSSSFYDNNSIPIEVKAPTMAYFKQVITESGDVIKKYTKGTQKPQVQVFNKSIDSTIIKAQFPTKRVKDNDKSIKKTTVYAKRSPTVMALSNSINTSTKSFQDRFPSNATLSSNDEETQTSKSSPNQLNKPSILSTLSYYHKKDTNVNVSPSVISEKSQSSALFPSTTITKDSLSVTRNPNAKSKVMKSKRIIKEIPKRNSQKSIFTIFPNKSMDDTISDKSWTQHTIQMVNQNESLQSQKKHDQVSESESLSNSLLDMLQSASTTTTTTAADKTTTPPSLSSLLSKMSSSSSPVSTSTKSTVKSSKKQNYPLAAAAAKKKPTKAATNSSPSTTETTISSSSSPSMTSSTSRPKSTSHSSANNISAVTATSTTGDNTVGTRVKVMKKGKKVEVNTKTITH